MTLEELFTVALGLGRQWRVAQCRFEGEPKRLELRLEHVPGEHFECPVCKDLCGIHDTIERRWRHARGGEKIRQIRRLEDRIKSGPFLLRERINF